MPPDPSRSEGTGSVRPELALYHFDACGYCQLVRAAAAKLDITYERRNIQQSDQFRDELLRATGRTRVPVLRIQRSDGSVEWLPESNDIIRYLRDLAGHPDPTPRWLDPLLRFAPWTLLLTSIFVATPYRLPLVVTGLLLIVARFALRLRSTF